MKSSAEKANLPPVPMGGKVRPGMQPKKKGKKKFPNLAKLGKKKKAFGGKVQG